MMSMPLLSDSEWGACRDIARTNGRSFYLASRLLSPERRRAILAAYAYCRIADDIVDRSEGDRIETQALLGAWEAELDAPVHPVAVAFAAVRGRYAIADEPVRELFDGMRADLTVDRYATWADLRLYCYQVAGTVGLIVAPILGCQDLRSLPRAAELGIAMQLTNILRDVGEDAAMGRIYLPLDELEHFGIDPDALRVGNPGPSFPDLMRFQMARARVLYDNALLATSSLSPSGRLTTLFAAELYSGILEQIETNGFDVFGQRAVVTRSRKGRKSTSAVMKFFSTSRSRRPQQSSARAFPGGLPSEAEAERWSL